MSMFQNIFKVYTGSSTKDVLKVKGIDVMFPENSKSPYEQIEWVKANWMKDITILTFSPYILNYLNVLIAKDYMSRDNLAVFYVGEGDDYLDLLCQDDKGRLIVDTRHLSDPISEIYKEYNDLIQHKKNNH